MEIPKIVMASIWRNDTKRRLEDRVEHLLSKTYPNMRWLWLVGDSFDGTYSALQKALLDRREEKEEVDIFISDSGISGDDHATRLRRLSIAVNDVFNRVEAMDEYLLWHESDLVSPPDIAERLLATGKCPVAGWPILRTQMGIMFYDTFAYRSGGVKFSNLPPYHSCYRPDRPFTVDSAGSVIMFRANDIGTGGVRCKTEALVEICNGLRSKGREIWVDPSIPVIQPGDLWVPTEQ